MNAKGGYPTIIRARRGKGIVMTDTLNFEIPSRIRRFLDGEVDIVTFRDLYDTKPEINDFLQGVIDGYLSEGRPFLPVDAPRMREGADRYRSPEVTYFADPTSYPGYIYGNAPFGCVRDYLTQEFRMCTTNVRTASGAWEFYLRVFNIFYQYDQSLVCRDEAYEDAYCFALDVIPDYLTGGASEMYIQEHILPLFPDTMPKGQRKKAVKAKIREKFRSDKGYPVWIQASEWPLGADGHPATYTGRKKRKGGEVVHYLFRDETDGSVIVVEQFH